MRSILTLIIFLFQLGASHAYSKQHCIRLLQERTSAMDNRVWQRQFQVSVDFEKECGAVVDAEALADSVSDQAAALFNMGEYSKAHTAAIRCLGRARLPSCYLEKGKSLLILGRIEEAREAFKNAKSAASVSIERSSREIKGAVIEIDRELWAAKRNRDRAVSGAANRFLTLVSKPPIVPKHAGETKTGTGIVISRSGRILTNNHVAEGCVEIAVVTAKGSYPATILAADGKADLVVLETGAEFGAAASFRTTPAELGEPVVVSGFPLTGLLSSSGTVTFGHVGALLGIGNDAQKLQITAPVQPGNSGGPLLDHGGLLVGVVVEKLNALKVAKLTGDIPQNVNFAIKAEVTQLFLRANGVEFSDSPPRPAASTIELAKIGKELTALITCRR